MYQDPFFEAQRKFRGGKEHAKQLHQARMPKQDPSSFDRAVEARARERMEVEMLRAENNQLTHMFADATRRMELISSKLDFMNEPPDDSRSGGDGLPGVSADAADAH